MFQLVTRHDTIKTKSRYDQNDERITIITTTTTKIKTTTMMTTTTTITTLTTMTTTMTTPLLMATMSTHDACAAAKAVLQLEL